MGSTKPGGELLMSLRDIHREMRERGHLKDPKPIAVKTEDRVLDSLETFSFDGHESGNCAVCREQFEEGLQTMRLPCGHLFCRDCVLPWLQQAHTCPTCRHELPGTPIYSRRP